MGVTQNIGTAVLTLRTDSAEYKRDIEQAKRDAQQLGQEWKAEESVLRGMNDSLKANARQIASLTRDFLGDNVIQRAHQMVTAVNNVGGASALAGSNQKRVNETVSEAISQYKAMGRQAPASLLELANATKQTHTETTTLTGSISSLGKSILTTAAGFFTAQAALAAFRAGARLMSGEIVDLVMHGSAVSDVSDNFERLTKQANLSGAALMGALRQGTHNTIADFELMKLVNEQLGAGLRLTEKDMGTLAKGAFALAQATGGDVKTALETMSDAMLTGRTRGLALLTGKINLTAAEKSLAASLSASADELTEEGKLQAARVQILKVVGLVTQRLGEQTDGLDERVAQLQTRWRNFNDELGKAVANSPVLDAAFTAMEDAVAHAFGATQKDMVSAIRHEIDQLAINVVEFAQTGVSAVAFLLKEFIALYKVAGQLQQAFDGDILTFKFLSLAAAQALNASTLGMGGGFKKDIDRINNDIDNLMVSMKQRGDALTSAGKAEDMVDAGASKLNQTLAEMRTKMVAANVAANANAEANTNAGGAARNSAAGFGAQGDALVNTGKQLDEFKKKLRELATELRGALKVDTLPGAKTMSDADFLKDFETKLDEVRRQMIEFQIKGTEAPAEIIAAFRRLNQISLERLNQEMFTVWDKARRVPNFIEANTIGGASAEDAKRVEQIDVKIGESARRRADILRDVSHTEAEIDFQRAEAGIESAKRWGASWQQVYAMEATLAKARLDLQVRESHQAFDDRVRDLKATSFVSADEYNAMLRDQEAKERLMVEAWRLSEQAKRDELAHTHNLALRLIDDLRAAAFDAARAAAEGISRMLLFPQRVSAQTKLAAQQARDEYEDAKQSAGETSLQVQAAFEKMQKAQQTAATTGTAASKLAAQKATDDYNKLARAGSESALQIQSAYERMRDAEDAANTSFAHRFVGAWTWIKESVAKILSDLLNNIFTGFVDGVIKKLTSSSLGERVGGWIASLLGGGNGGGGNGIADTLPGAGKLASKLGGLFGGGASAATAMTVDTLPGALAATTATVDTLAGATAAGAGTTAGAAGGGLAGSLGAFFTNPWTIGIGAALVTGLILAKKFGKDKVNKPRDQFLSQWGDPSNKDVGGAQWNLASKLTQFTGEPGGGHLLSALVSARKDMNAFRSAEDGIIAEFAQHGIKNIKKYSTGGFVMPGIVQPAILHGGARGEMVMPMDRLERMFRSMGNGGRNVVVNVTANAIDSSGMREVFRKSIVPQIKEALFYNSDGLSSAVAGAR